jgi:hypothetical protein
MATCANKVSELLTNETNKSHSKQTLIYESLVPHIFRSLTRAFILKSCTKNFCDSHFLIFWRQQVASGACISYIHRHVTLTPQFTQEPPITKAPLATTTDRALTGREMRRNRQDDVRSHASRQVRAWLASGARHQPPGVSLQVMWLVPRWVEHLTFEKRGLKWSSR